MRLWRSAAAAKEDTCAVTGDFVLETMRARGPGRCAISLARGRDRLHVMPTSTGYEDRQRLLLPLEWARAGPDAVRSGPAYVGRRGAACGTKVISEASDRAKRCSSSSRMSTNTGSGRASAGSFSGWRRPAKRRCGSVARFSPRSARCFDCSPRRSRDWSISLDLRDGKAKSAGVASAMAYAATMALYDDLLGGEGGPRNARSRSIDRVLAQVRRRLHEPLDVQALADLAGLSRAHFSRVFKTCEGVPPAEFVLAERMRRAASLLVSGAANVKAVARDCGFDDPNYFAKAFRRRFGASPTEF